MIITISSTYTVRDRLNQLFMQKTPEDKRLQQCLVYNAINIKHVPVSPFLGQGLADGMPYSCAGLLNLLPRQADCQADLDSWLLDVDYSLGARYIRRQGLDSCDEDTLSKTLHLPLVSKSKQKKSQTYLVHHILQQLLLIFQGHPPRPQYFRLQHHQHDWVLWCTRTVHPVTPGI